MDFLERFKNRQTLSPTVEIELNGIYFTIARFAEAEYEVARKKRDALLRMQGIEPKDASPEDTLGAFCEALAEQIKRHIKKWRSDTKQLPEFSQQTLDICFQEMSGAERAMLGLRFVVALDEDAAKKNGHLPQNGVKSSSAGLNSSSGTTTLTADSAIGTVS